MKLNEFARRHGNRPVVFKTSEVRRQRHPDLMMSVVQKMSIDTLTGVKGINYDDMCRQALGRMVDPVNLTAGDAALVIGRGYYLYGRKKDDRHRRTYGSERPQPTKITGGQRLHIQKLMERRVPYAAMLNDALGETIDINKLTYEQAVSVIKAGKRLSARQKRQTGRSDLYKRVKKISPFQQIDIDLLTDAPGISYTNMCAGALGRIILMDDLTFEQADEVIKTGKKMAGLRSTLVER